jgi:hypothetical protein
MANLLFPIVDVSADLGALPKQRGHDMRCCHAAKIGAETLCQRPVLWRLRHNTGNFLDFGLSGAEL